MMRQRSLLVVDLLNQEVERFSFDLCSAKLSICCSSSFRGANRGLPKLDLFLLFRNPDHPSSGYLAQSTREKTGASTWFSQTWKSILGWHFPKLFYCYGQRYLMISGVLRGDRSCLQAVRLYSARIDQLLHLLRARSKSFLFALVQGRSWFSGVLSGKTTTCNIWSSSSSLPINDIFQAKRRLAAPFAFVVSDG